MQFKLIDPELREELGLSTGTVTLPSHHGHMTQPHRSRAETEQLVLRAVYDSPGPVTRLHIARELGRSKSPWLYAVVESLVAAGLLIKTQSIGQNGVLVYWYEANQ